MVNIVYEYYDNIHKFVNTIANRPNNDVSGFSNASETNTTAFAGMSLKNAYEACKNGIPEKKTLLERAVCDFANNADIKRRATRNYYYGYAPNVPRAIIGLPTSMKQRIKVPTPTKALHIIYNATANCGTDAKTIEKASIATLNLIYSLEMNNIRCKLSVSPFFVKDGTEKAVCILSLKDFSDSFDFLKLSFPLTQVAFFRRLGFKWAETIQGLTQSWYGYGSSIDDAHKMTEVLADIMPNDNPVILTVKTWENIDFNVSKMIDQIKTKKF